ncbi:hypothetical protein YC2023_032782 [Brassica napus]
MKFKNHLEQMLKMKIHTQPISSPRLWLSESEEFHLLCKKGKSIRSLDLAIRVTTRSTSLLGWTQPPFSEPNTHQTEKAHHALQTRVVCRKNDLSSWRVTWRHQD